MSHKIRGQDNRDEMEAIVRQRNGNGRESRKTLVVIIAILTGLSGFFGSRWVSSQELTDEKVLKKAYNYTDQLYEAKIEPHLKQIDKNQVTVQRMALNIERITTFMEIKFGMAKRGRNHENP